MEELKAPKVALLLSVLMAAAKLYSGFSAGSLSLIASGFDSIFDSLASLASFILLRMSLEPADKEHPYGHSRIEPVASLGQAGVLTVVALSLGYFAFQRFGSGHEISEITYPLIVAFACMIVTFGLWLYLGKVAQRTGSSIVAADRVHYFADLASNIIVFVGFAISKIFKIQNIDPVLTLILCAMILFSVYRIVVNSVKDLVDHHDPDVENKVRSIIKKFYPRALGATRVRSRKSGRHSALDLELLTCRLLRFQEVHEISHEVEEKILGELSSLDIVIHPEPCKISDCPSERDCQLKSFTKP